jgi:cytochrome c oxidase subunit II
VQVIHVPERSPVRSTRSPKSKLARWAVVPIGAAVTVILAGCTQAQMTGFLPEGSTDTTNHTAGITALWVNSWIVLLAVGVVTWLLVIWAAVVYRRRKGQTGLPVQLRYNLPIEIFYTIVPLILVLGFFAFTARDQNAIESPIADPDVQIEVMGKRWSWDFNYVTEDRYSVGIQGQEVEGDFVDVDQLPVLYLPVNETIEIKLESRDVVHSFWILDFLYKKDVIPAKSNYMYFTALKEGEYDGKCAELCGEYHSQMLFKVMVVSRAEYDRQMELLREGQLDSSYNVNQNLPGNGNTEGDDE